VQFLQLNLKLLILKFEKLKFNSYTFAMSIFIEDFLLQNILINYCLLRLVELTTKSKTKFIRLFFASLIGGLISVFVAVIIKNNVLINITKLICGLIVVFVAFKTKLKGFLFNFILLFLYTYALGGSVMGLSGAVYNTNFGVVMQSKVSLEMVCLIVIAVTYVFQLVAKHLKQKLKSNNYIYELTLYLGKNAITINAFLDSGNMLTHNGEPVVILNLQSYMELTKTNLVNYYLANLKVIKTSTVCGNENLKLFIADKIVIKNGKHSKVIKHQQIAVTNNFKADNYSALISPALI